VLVKAEAGVSKPIPRFIRGRRVTKNVKQISGEFNVKVFIGTEYECRRGHRFMMEHSQKCLQLSSNASQNPNMKESGSKIANSEMPLYFACPSW